MWRTRPKALIGPCLFVGLLLVLYISLCAVRPNPQSYVLRAQVSLSQGDVESAITDCSRAIEADPDFAFAYLIRGQAHQRSRVAELAAADFTTAIALEPKQILAHLGRAQVYESQGMVVEAEADRETIKQLVKTDDPQLPFQHSASDEIHEIFMQLEVRSEADYRALSKRDRYVWDVSWFETEVMNGGVDQYFFNSAGDHWMETLEALEAIGATQSHRLLQQASGLFSDTPNPRREVRQAQLRELLGDSESLDDLIEGEIDADLYQRLLDYWKQADPADE